ncbi:MAG TPA: nuclear transport factor 2 family protein [Solirubrobacterales bacterium]|jgi:ketosteroid isomerase-like protein|nr:nuclear transport factor 2 family protein [Solirubrobacterales bacterium]
MSDNVELLREFWRVWRDEGGAGLVERYDEFFIEDAEWSPPMREMTGSRYVGRHGIEQYVHDLGHVLTDLRGEVEEVTEVAPDVVRSRVRIHGQGRVSGMTLDAPMIGIARLRDGRMSLAWASYDPEAAKRAETAIVNGEPLPV